MKTKLLKIAEIAPHSIGYPLAVVCSRQRNRHQSLGLVLLDKIFKKTGTENKSCKATVASPKTCIKKGTLLTQNRNTFYLISLILVSDMYDNSSRSIENPLISGPPEPDPRHADCTHTYL